MASDTSAVTQGLGAVKAVGQEESEPGFMGKLLSQSCLRGNPRDLPGEVFPQRINKVCPRTRIAGQGDSVSALGIFTPSCLMASGGDC